MMVFPAVTPFEGRTWEELKVRGYRLSTCWVLLSAVPYVAVRSCQCSNPLNRLWYGHGGVPSRHPLWGTVMGFAGEG
jgi:hypothetical protein